MNLWSWICSATSVAMIWQMGNRSIWGPIIGLLSQMAWTVFAVTQRQWGLLPGVAAFWIVHMRNLLKWRRELRRH